MITRALLRHTDYSLELLDKPHDAAAGEMRQLITNLQLYHAISQKRYMLEPKLLQNVNMKSH